MSVALFAILGPLGAAALILALRRWAAWLALLGAGVGLVAGLATLVRVGDGERFAATLPGLPEMPLRLVVEPVSALLTATVATVAALVLLYAVGYMGEERDQPRFFAGMTFFVAAMQTLVLAGDWLLFLVAWELIALASYGLIGFWFERPGVGAAATRAFATTRAADLGLYIGIFVLVAETGTTSIPGTLNLGGTSAIFAGLALLAAAMGKSAQAPLQGWLLDAMAGPTPVSALLHSATLVVAGIVLLVRAFPLLTPGTLLVVGIVGGVSALVTGLVAIAQRDLKRLLAASTASQLGLMLLALGAGSVPAAVLHLVANAAMKSSLFLGAGVFQHDRGSTAFADLRGAGPDRRAVFVAFTVSGLALAGVPPLAGFWSKDSVIAAALHSSRAGLLAPLALGAALLTGVYISRALRLLWQPSGGNQTTAEPEGGAGWGWMEAGVAALAILAATLGLAVEPIGRLLDVEVPEDVAGLLLGLAAAGTGLVAGWFIPAGRLLGPVYGPALAGFRVRGGVVDVVVRPAMLLARAGDHLDRRIHAGILTAGRWALGVAAGGRALDTVVHAAVVGVGAAAMSTARASRFSDEGGIDRLIAALVDRTRRLGVRARRLQTGLVHRELLVAAAGTALVLVFVLLS